MQWVYTPYVLPLLIVAVTVGILAVYIGERRAAPGSAPLMVTMGAAFVWTFFYAFEFLSPDYSSKLFWNNIEYFGIAVLPLAWMAFTAEYTGRNQWLAGKTLAGLVAIPTLTVFLVWTNPFHHWMYSEISLSIEGTFPYLARTYGPWFWIWTAYSYALLGFAFWFLIKSYRGSSIIRRRQIILLVAGSLVPWLGNALYLLKANLIPYYDFAPIMFAVPGVLGVWIFSRYRFLNVLPMARTVLIDRMPDGVVVLNDIGQVVDINPAAAEILSVTPQKVAGQHIARVFSIFPDTVEPVLKTTDTQLKTTIGEGEEQRFFSIILKSLYDANHVFSGRLVIIREVTEDKHAKLELEKSHALLVATFEATPDGIMVLNSQGKCLHYNQRFVDMWHINHEITSIDGEHDFTGDLLDQLGNPAAYYRIMNKLSLQPDAETYDILELKDGRVFERYSCPQRIQDRRVGRVWSFRDITEQRRAEEKLRYLSTHDILTGLYNRVYFEEEINRLENSRQFPISIIMADVDGLKEANDVYGHQAGDALLRKAAEVLRQACRSEDMVARIGGDEFGILLPYSNSAVADKAVSRIQNQILLSRAEGGEYPISLSVGAATAEKGQSLRKVLRQADQAMYQVKSSRTKRRAVGGQMEHKIIRD